MDPEVKTREPRGPCSRGKVTEKWLKRLARVECPDTTYIANNFPTVLKKGNGILVTDVGNKKYLDFTASFGVLALGHRSQTTLRAIKKQTARLIHGMGDVHPAEVKIKLLELLGKITPFTKPKSMLGLSGSDAVEIAIKTSVLATNRSKFISFAGGYHGVQLAPLLLNHSKNFTRGFEALLKNQSIELPFPYFKENGPKSNFEFTLEPNAVLNILEDHLRSKLYAGLILEPIQGRGGIRIFTKNFLQECKELCIKYGTLLIFDEIMTGFGRTGKMFAYEHSQIVPDLLCLGKAMGGGLPLSACVGDIMDVWGVSTGSARHTQTFLGHPLACAVGYETILQIKNKLPDFQNELIKINKEFNLFLKKLESHHLEKNLPCFVRGNGFMHGLWFYTQKKDFGPNLIEKLCLKNILSLPSGENHNVIVITPPLIAKAEHYKKMLNTVLNLLLP